MQRLAKTDVAATLDRHEDARSLMALSCVWWKAGCCSYFQAVYHSRREATDLVHRGHFAYCHTETCQLPIVSESSEG